MIRPHGMDYCFEKRDPREIVVVRTPFRVSFFGGGTDYPAYYLRRGGEVLATSITKYAYFMLNRLPEIVEERYRLHYKKYEAVNHIEQIEHPGVRGVLEFLNISDGLNLHYTADLPSKSGLGSSSCFIVGLLHALHIANGVYTPRAQLAELAIHIEQDVVGETVGSQDQYMCAMGGLQHVRFEKDGTVHSERLDLSGDRLRALEERLMLFFTSTTRHASEIAGEQVSLTKDRLLDRQLEDMKAIVNEGERILVGDESLDEFGKLLDNTWQIKRGLSPHVTTGAIDEMYDAAVGAGALGGKLLGAGSGGFMLFYVPPEKQDAVRSALHGRAEVTFGFDVTGSQMIHAQ